MTRKNAEILGLEALGWLAGEEGALERFLAASGVDETALRAAAGRPETIVAVLDFLLANEDLLLGYCDGAALDPRLVHHARHVLERGG